MAAAIVQTAGNAATGASVAASFSTAPSAGNIVIAVINSDNVFTVSGSGTRRYQFLADQQFDIWEYTGTLPTTVTVTPGAADYVAITLIELSGVASFDLAGSGTATSGALTTATAPSITTTAANDLVLACVALHGTTTATEPGSPVWGNGFSVARTTGAPDLPGSSSAACGQFVGVKTQAAAGAVGSTTVTWSNGADNADAVQVAYKAAATGTNGSVTAVRATASAAVAAPSVSGTTIGNTSVSAVAAAASAAAPVAVVQASTQLAGGGPATASASIRPPAVLGVRNAAIASVAASASAGVPTPAVSSIGSADVAAVAATATGSAPAPTVLAQINVTVLAAMAEADALATIPTVIGTASVSLAATPATATAVARPPQVGEPREPRNIVILGTTVPVSGWGVNGPSVAWQAGAPTLQHPHDTTGPVSGWGTSSPTN